MSRTAHKLISASGGKAYEIEQSLICSQADGSKLRRTPSSEGNRKTWTFSTWCKRSRLGLGNSSGTGSNWNLLMGAYAGSASDNSHYWQLGFSNNDELTCGGWVNNFRVTNRRFRDTSAWYHIVLQIDTTQSTASNRTKVYVNGVQETSFSTTYDPAQNFDLAINNTVAQSISDVAYDAGTGPYHFDGYIAETHLFDGAVVAASEFGETDSVTGQWIPKQYTGTASYGTNGYYMKYVSGAIGTDSSGQGNNYTTTNLANSDVVLDTPTNNHCIVNSLDNSGNLTLGQGNTEFHASDSNRVCFKGTMAVSSGKWYYEYTHGATADGSIGVVNASATSLVSNGMVGNSSYGWAVNNDGAKENGNSETASYMSGGYTTNDVIGVALNMDDGEITFYKNGSSAGVAFNNLGSKGAMFPAICTHSDSGNFDKLNFGQKSFAHTPPTGYKAWNTSNLSAPTVKKSPDHFKTVLYTGTGNTDYDITGVGFQPDLNWIKKRSGADNHVITDAVRGAGKVIKSEANTAEGDWTDYVGPFLADGIRLNDVQQGNAVNESGQTYVMWNWKANGSGSSNSDGAQTSTVSANTTSGFSIVTGTGTGSSTTYGHGLGVEPKVIIIKSRSVDGNWFFYTSGIDGIPYNTWQYAYLNTDDDFDPSSEIASNTTTFAANYTNGVTFVSYCFAEVEGFSKFAIYEGNGSTDGPFINLGFTPAWIIIRNQADGESWWMLDSTRDPYGNLVTEVMYANANSAESGISSSGGIDMLSNGFKIKGSNSGMNGSGQIMFYMAFAEFPFKYANAR